MNLAHRCVLVLTLLGAAVSAGAADDGTPDPAFQSQAALFSYDTGAAFDLKEHGVETREGVTVRDVSFIAAPQQPPVKAYLVVPQGKGPFAGVLWVHWLGEPETTNRTQYLKEAIALAPRGAVSLLVDAMWSAPKWYEERVPDTHYDTSLRQVIALRRAMDLLLKQPGVDPARIGFVGHDYGAMYGMIAAGVDRRAKTYVYVAATQSLLDWAFFAAQPKSKADYLRQNANLELTDYLRQVKNASTLFQFANSDVYVSRSDTFTLLGATQGRKERKFYDAEHSMSPPQVAQDRDAWLATELGLAAASVAPAPK
jgi:dienelactone hydrolase